jgi:hypothetical protein
LRLAREKDLHQFHPWNLKVGKQPHGLENRVLKVLRFIDDNHDTPAGARFPD